MFVHILNIITFKHIVKKKKHTTYTLFIHLVDICKIPVMCYIANSLPSSKEGPSI